MRREEWGRAFGPFDDDGEPDPVRPAAAHHRAARRAAGARTFHIRSIDGAAHEIEASAIPIVGHRGTSGAMVFFWPTEAETVKVKVWGARGSVPAPGPETMRYGGNTSCVQVTLADGTDRGARRRHGHPHPGPGAARASPRGSTSSSPTCTSTTSRG